MSKKNFTRRNSTTPAASGTLKECPNCRTPFVSGETVTKTFKYCATCDYQDSSSIQKKETK